MILLTRAWTFNTKYQNILYNLVAIAINKCICGKLFEWNFGKSAVIKLWIYQILIVWMKSWFIKRSSYKVKYPIIWNILDLYSIILQDGKLEYLSCWICYLYYFSSRLNILREKVLIFLRNSINLIWRMF